MQTVTIQPNATHRSVTKLPNGDVMVLLASKNEVERIKSDWDTYSSVYTGTQVITNISELDEAGQHEAQKFFSVYGAPAAVEMPR